MTEFVPGLRLSELFFHEAVRPILDDAFPGLVYSTGLIGYGSDVLGFDTVRSTDHEWGLRMVLFLSEADEPIHGAAITEMLRQWNGLPPTSQSVGCGPTRAVTAASQGDRAWCLPRRNVSAQRR